MAIPAYSTKPAASSADDFDLKALAETTFEPLHLDAPVTLEAWLKRAQKEFVATQCVRVVLSKTREDLTAMASRDPDTCLELVEDLHRWQERCKDGAETFGGAAARLMVALSRHAEESEPAGPEGGAA